MIIIISYSVTMSRWDILKQGSRPTVPICTTGCVSDWLPQKLEPTLRIAQPICGLGSSTGMLTHSQHLWLRISQVQVITPQFLAQPPFTLSQTTFLGRSHPFLLLHSRFWLVIYGYIQYIWLYDVTYNSPSLQLIRKVTTYFGWHKIPTFFGDLRPTTSRPRAKSLVSRTVRCSSSKRLPSWPGEVGYVVTPKKR